MGDGRAIARRRLTLPPNGLGSFPSGSSPAHASGGSRFSCLPDVSIPEPLEDLAPEVEDECLSEVPFEAAMEVIDETTLEAGWKTVKRKGRKTDEEVAEDFWREIGFPTPASRFWERGSCSTESTGTTPRPQSPPLGMPLLGGSGSSSSGRRKGAVVARPVRTGWRGPVPRPRISPPAVLGMFMPNSPSTPPPPSNGNDRAAVGTETLATGGEPEPEMPDRGVCGVNDVQNHVGPRSQVTHVRTSNRAYLGRCFAGLWKKKTAARVSATSDGAKFGSDCTKPSSYSAATTTPRRGSDPSTAAIIGSTPQPSSSPLTALPSPRSFAEVVASRGDMSGRGGALTGAAGGQQAGGQGRGQALPPTRPPCCSVGTPGLAQAGRWA